MRLIVGLPDARPTGVWAAKWGAGSSGSRGKSVRPDFSVDSIGADWARAFQRGVIGRLSESAPLKYMVPEATGDRHVRRGHHDFKKVSGLEDGEG